VQSKELGYDKKIGYLCLNNRAGVGHFRIEGFSPDKLADRKEFYSSNCL